MMTICRMAHARAKLGRGLTRTFTQGLFPRSDPADTDPAEETRVDQAVAGDRDALTDLLKRYGPRLPERLRSEIGGRFQSMLDAEDILQVSEFQAAQLAGIDTALMGSHLRKDLVRLYEAWDAGAKQGPHATEPAKWRELRASSR